MRSNSPLPRLPTRFMGYLRRCGLFIHLRIERAFRHDLNETPPNSGSPSSSLPVQRSVPSTTWHLMGQAVNPQWQQLCQMISPSSGISFATIPFSDLAESSLLAFFGTHPYKPDTPLAATAARVATVEALTKSRLETSISLLWPIGPPFFFAISFFRKGVFGLRLSREGSIGCMREEK